MTITIFKCILAGIVATAVMGLSTNIFSLLSKKRFYLIPTLGTMLTGQTTNYRGLSYSHKSIYTGAIVHYLIGCFSSFWFYKLSFFYGGITFTYTLLFGLFTGLMAMGGWRILFYVHSRPPRIQIVDYLSLIFAAHIIFALVLFFIFGWYDL